MTIDMHDRTNNSQPDSARGAAANTKATLAVYDLFVLRFSNSFIWKCPSRLLLDLYDRLVSDRHLDVGVGTGYFLDKCRFPVAVPSIALLDLNANSLQVTAKRLERYKPSCHQADVLKPIGARPAVTGARVTPFIGVTCSSISIAGVFR